MMNDIPCDVAKDLMPSYIEGLTSETTNTLLTAHVAHCEDCRQSLAAMREGTDLPPEPDPAEKKEIDFLKKNRKWNRIVLLSAVCIVLCFLAVYGIRYYLIGEPVYGVVNIYDIRVEGNHLKIKGEAKSNVYYRVKGFSEEEKDGVVTFTARGARRLFSADDDKWTFNADYYYDRDITAVCLDGRIIWHDGERISGLASDLYETRHAYMGDMPANQRTADVLNFSEHFGPYQNELLSGAEPLTWRLLLEEEIAPEKREEKEALMQSIGYMMLAVIENLDAVEVVYECAGKTLSATVTAEGATAFFGQDIKQCMSSARLTDELLHKTNLHSYAYYDSAMPPVERSVRFQMLLDTEAEISAISFALFQGEALLESGGGMNADETPLRGGDTMWFDLGEPGVGVPSEELRLEFIIHTTDGKEHPAEGRIVFPGASGTLHPLILTGSAEEGFHISQD